MLTRGGIRVLLAAALVALALPSSALAQIDGTPLNVMADGLGAIQVRQDGVAAGLFYDPDDNPGHAGLEIKDGGTLYPLEAGDFDRTPGRTTLVAPTLTDLGAAKILRSVYTVGPNLRVSEEIRYTDGVPRVDITYGIQNVSLAPVSLRVGALADLFVGNNDSGNGVIANVAPRFVGGREESTGLVYGLQEVTPWLAYQEGDYEAVFNNFAGPGLNNTVDSAAPDNGVGVEFAVDLPAGGQRNIDVRWLLASTAPRGTITPPALSGEGNPGLRAPTIEQLPPPVPGKTVNVSVRKGRIFLKLPRTNKYIELTGAMQIPLRTTVDARKGRINMVATSDATQLAWFYDGMFLLGQTGGSKPITSLKLTEPLARCPKAKRSGARAAAKRRTTRKLWGEGKGAFRTSGKYSSATVRGTKWVVTDRCNGTETRVTQGSVTVRQFKPRKTVIVRAGKRYLARSR